MPDTNMRQRLVLGDEAAFREIYGALNPSMVRLARAVIGSRAIAEEVAQETWLAVISGIERFEGKSSLKNWIFAILSNKARTRARREGRNVALAPTPAPPEDGTPAFDDAGRWLTPPALWDEITPERTLAGRQTWQIVTEAISTLPAVQQAILDLVQGEKMSAAEVARLLEISEGNVRVQLHRARERIRRTIDAEFGRKKGRAKMSEK